MAAVALALLAAGCGGEQDPSLGGGTATTVPRCSAVVEEPLDPASGQHVLPGAPAPTYSTDPPTSGAHAVGTFPTGVLQAPIDRPVQVGMLEGGAVLLQYNDLSADERSALEALATGPVTVAPNPGLTARVVATAWRFKQSCQALDVPTLSQFVSDHGGKGVTH